MNNLVNHKSTGYQPPHWLTVLWDWVKSLFTTHELVKLSAVPYPSSKITDITAVPVAMQGQWPNCVEETITSVKEYCDYKATGSISNLSPFDLFFKSGPSENGTSAFIALGAADTKGIAEKAYFPDPNINIPYNGVTIAETAVAIQNASTHKINGYMITTDVSSLDLCGLINQAGVILVGGAIDDQWWLPSWQTLKMPLQPPVKNSPSLSHHMWWIYGYSIANGVTTFYCRNHWSKLWNPGMGGNFTITDKYIPSIYEVAIFK